MRAHIVENGVVVNTIVVESLDFPVPQGQTLIAGGEGGIGWLWDGEMLTAPASGPAPVPQAVSKAQGKAALIQGGFWGDVIGYRDSITDSIEQALFDVALNDTTEWRRDSPSLNAAAGAIGLTEQDMDALFTAASAIQL